ncbi:uncharacterized protein LOC141685953 [Apium graveolens]|uniref:uncharacterized protein LOC141685953 n=1 Tax=Apium graveolens TaxID=4045 RepID=UPI003D797AD9
MAFEGVHESLKQHFSRVWDFGHELMKINPNNTVKIAGTRVNDGDINRFQRMYVCYSALKNGWKAGCRPVIGVNGCFLKTVCGGQLLSAVGRDRNNQMYPICHVVVETESTDSWRWFVDLMKADLELGNGTGFTVISDQQKGLENAIKELLPAAEHRFCTTHIYSNFRKKQFWAAACSTHPVAYKNAMKQIATLCKPAHEHLKKLNPAIWSKAYISTIPKADNIENNMAEYFNLWIINERYLPLLNMIREIHYKLMTRVREKREGMMTFEMQLCPRIKKLLDVAVKNSREWTASWDGSSRYIVKSGTKAVTVDLEKKTCDRRVFDLKGIPCCHAIAAIHDKRQQPIDYVSDYFKRDKYLQSYSFSIKAVKGEEYWEET